MAQRNWKAIGLGLLVLIPAVAAMVKSTPEICSEGQVMWEGGNRVLEFRVICWPTDGPFKAQWRASDANATHPWTTLEPRFQHVADAAQALAEEFSGGR